MTLASVYVFDRNIGRNLTTGDIILLDGNVTEYRSSSAYVYLTEITTPRNVRTVSRGNVVQPVVLGRSTTGIVGRKNLDPPTEQFSGLDGGDVFAEPNNISLISRDNPRLRPDKYGMDFWESLSGELVTVQGVTATGRPANAFGDQWVSHDPRCIHHEHPNDVECEIGPRHGLTLRA